MMYLLYHTFDIPDSLEDFQSVAIGDGGYIAISDDNGSNHHGIPEIVRAQIERHHNDNLELIAIGHKGDEYWSDLEDHGRPGLQTSPTPCLTKHEPYPHPATTRHPFEAI